MDIDKRDALMQKALADSTFTEELLTDPEGAAAKLGFEITPEAVEAIKKGADQIRQDAHSIPTVVPVRGVYVTTQPPPPKPPKGK